MDYESGISRYQWGIGSSQFAADVVPLTNVTGERVLKDVKYSGGTKKMFVTPVVRQQHIMGTASSQMGYAYILHTACRMHASAVVWPVSGGNMVCCSS
jgi:hypothetical protein